MYEEAKQTGDSATGASVGACDDARRSLDTFAASESGWYAPYHGD